MGCTASNEEIISNTIKKIQKELNNELESNSQILLERGGVIIQTEIGNI